MKKLLSILVSCTLLALPAAQAQLEPDLPLTDRMKAMKVAFITEKIGLTPEQSQGFWPVYEEFQNKQRDIRQANRPGKNINQMSDVELEKYLYQNLENEAQLLELKRTYLERFQEVITIRQIALLQRAERDFNRQVVERLLELRKRRGRN
jgi:hypothetical protein